MPSYPPRNGLLLFSLPTILLKSGDHEKYKTVKSKIQNIVYLAIMSSWKMFKMLLSLLFFFSFIDPALFWFRVRNINITFKGSQFFCAGKLNNMPFMKNRTMTGKDCPFHFESYDKEKLRLHKSFLLNSPLSQVFELFCYCTKRLVRYLCLSYCLALFLSVLVFVVLWIFSMFFLKHLIVIYIQFSSFEETFFY